MGNITPYCEGCEKINPQNDCSIYPNPAKVMRWVDDKRIQVGCAFNSAKHLQAAAKTTEKKRVGQQKQKKK